MSESENSNLEVRIREGLGTLPAADFDAWQSRHGASLAYLNPVVTAMHRRRRLVVVRIASAAAAVAMTAVVAVWMFASEERAFAQTISTIKKAETVSWTIAWYDRMYSVDEKRTWLRAHPRWERSYLAPNRWRDVRYNHDGSIASVDIEDTSTGKVLHLNMTKKEAMLKNEPSGQFGRGKPFQGITRILESKPIEFAGQREVDGVKVNVFRNRRELPDGGTENTEIWLDAETKRLVGYCTNRGDDFFNPRTAPDRDNSAEENFSKGTIAGVIKHDIVFDAQLDPSLFSMTPPQGFTIVEPPQSLKITEDMMIEWLRLAARANDGAFVELDHGLNLEWHNAIVKKDESDRSRAEQQYLLLSQEYVNNGVYSPLTEFAEQFTEPHSLRYLGKGVRLGGGDRIVCYYKLTSTGKYRAVYGDLRVADIDPSKLPLPVD